MHAILNMSAHAIEVELLALAGRLWQLAADTAQTPPQVTIEPARQARCTRGAIVSRSEAS